ncbi:MAG: FKBP-type peptidyl-prolyl cis-trans isomerase [Bacteroidales bacterium]|jgi:FKBP-type peptidyl-prolyl cis-trans isomerase|nr:FKBP-type peptidyl-prolyl cis-trans isomerase [Bacteroidales bacterium]MDD3273447.1 FKBP-type peptidyl-prolyl cis-trans isomerase [Bacteroidales bacterium]MDD4058245.1 FKBP-type peptidyl-prolyl cis-trans isomerase [Bacteroidales bacterium]
MKKFLKISLVISLSFMAFSCAVEREESAEEIEKRVIDSYITVVHNDSLNPSATGLFTITKAKGSGDLIEDSSFVYVTYSTRDLKGNILSTTDEEVAKRVGTYSVANYYGPYLVQTSIYSLIRGVEEGLSRKRVGDEFSLIIPSWLSDYGYTGTNKTHTSPTIYDFKIHRVVKDIEQFQSDSLRSYSNKYFNGLDTTANDYYFKIIEPTEGDSVKIGDLIEYYYVGKLLNGFVFDTNIEDTARKYGLYNSTKQYAAATYTVIDPENTTGSDDSNNSVIKGVADTFLKMKYGERAVTFFSSEYGYGNQEQNFGIYQPLFFEIKVVEEKAD